MSLLLDALKKAEANKNSLQEQQNTATSANERLRLEPIEPSQARPPRPYASDAGAGNSAAQQGQQQAQARQMLSLRRSVLPKHSRVLIAGLIVATCCLLLTGVYFLWSDTSEVVPSAPVEAIPVNVAHIPPISSEESAVSTSASSPALASAELPSPADQAMKRAVPVASSAVATATEITPLFV